MGVSVRKSILPIAASAVLIAFNIVMVSKAAADPIPYSPIGTQNNIDYINTATFIAPSDGVVTGYYVSSDAGYDQQILVLALNDNTPVAFNHDAPAFVYGTQFNFGTVTAGQALDFRDQVTSGDPSIWHVDTSKNSDGINHVYSYSYGGDASPGLIPAGTYVAFEDLRNGGDLDYNDISFVFTFRPSDIPVNGNAPAAPEPATWAMMLLGFCGIGFMAYRRKSAGLRFV
jgi:hypothetical protein